MPFTCIVSSRFLSGLCLFSLILGTASSSLGGDPSSMGSAGPGMYEQAFSHAEGALHATREKDFNNAVKHAEMGITSAHAAQKDFGKQGIVPEAQKEFAEGIKQLEAFVKYAREKKAEEAEKAVTETIVMWAPSETKKGCHGDGCVLNVGGCASCANPGQSGCNRFFPTRKCTTVGCSCYCM